MPKKRGRETEKSDSPSAPKARNLYGLPSNLINLNTSADENEDRFSSRAFSVRQRKTSQYSEYSRLKQAESKDRKELPENKQNSRSKANNFKPSYELPTSLSNFLTEEITEASETRNGEFSIGLHNLHRYLKLKPKQQISCPYETKGKESN